MKQKKPFTQKLNNILFFLLGILAVVIAGVIFINFRRMLQEVSKGLCCKR